MSMWISFCACRIKCVSQQQRRMRSTIDARQHWLRFRSPRLFGRVVSAVKMATMRTSVDLRVSECVCVCVYEMWTIIIYYRLLIVFLFLFVLLRFVTFFMLFIWPLVVVATIIINSFHKNIEKKRTKEKIVENQSPKQHENNVSLVKRSSIMQLNLLSSFVRSTSIASMNNVEIVMNCRFSPSSPRSSGLFLLVPIMRFVSLFVEREKSTIINETKRIPRFPSVVLCFFFFIFLCFENRRNAKNICSFSCSFSWWNDGNVCTKQAIKHGWKIYSSETFMNTKMRFHAAKQREKNEKSLAFRRQRFLVL